MNKRIKIEVGQLLSILLGSGILFVLSVLLRTKIGNLQLFLLGTVAFCLSYCFGCWCFQNLKLKHDFYQYLLEAFIVIIGICWVIINFVEEGKGLRIGDISDSLVRYQMSSWLLIAIIIMGVVCVAVTSKRNIRFKKMRFVISAAYALLVSAIQYVPNIFMTDSVTYHMHAYDNSIYNVLAGVPYDEISRSIYGHYAFIYYIPVKLLKCIGISYHYAIPLVTALISLVTVAATLYILNQLIKNDIIYYLLMFALGEFFFQEMGTPYWQLYPHRIVFPVLIAVIAYSNVKKEKSKTSFMWLWILSVISIIWNTETGIICALVSSVYVLLQIYHFELPLYKKTNLFCILKCGVFGSSSGIAAFILTNIFNLLAGGNFLGIKEFIYPIMSTSFQVGALQLELPSWRASWFGVITIFLVFIMYGIVQSFKEQECNKYTAFYMTVALSGLGLSTYYMNRSASGNLTICFFQIIILFAIIFRRVYHIPCSYINYRKIKIPRIDITIGLKYVTVIVCLVLILGNANVKNVLQIRIDNAWNETGFNQLAQEVERDIPKGTVGIGMGVPELYSAIERNVGIYTIDWSDIEADPDLYYNYISERLEKEDAFFANLGVVGKVDEAQKFQLIKKYKVPGIENAQFGYYKRAQ